MSDIAQPPEVVYDVDDGIATVSLNRPAKLNAWTPTMHDGVLSAFDRADADDDVRVVIVTGSGRGFCAGADLSAGSATWDPESANRRELRQSRGSIGGYPREGGALVTVRIMQSAKPVIAAINGPAVGIGASMTLPMDIRIASEQARFGFVFARRGLVPDAASSWFLPRIVGITRALEWMTTGRIFDAREACRAGFVSQVVPEDSLMTTALEVGREIAEKTSAVSVALTRMMLWKSLGDTSPWDAHRLESKGYALLGGGADAREGTAAFLEKRPPRFPARVSVDLPSLVEHWPASPKDVTIPGQPEVTLAEPADENEPR